MEENTHKSLMVGLFWLLVILQLSCKSMHVLPTENEISNFESPNALRPMTYHFDQLPVEGCEIIWDTVGVVTVQQLINRNSNRFLYCVNGEARKGNDNAIDILVGIVDVWERQRPVEILDLTIFSKVYDKRLFNSFLEMTKFDTEWSYSGNDIIHSPLHIIIGLTYLEPMIDLIDGMPKYEYMKNSKYQYAYNCSAAEYYMQIKTLWQEGRITLKAQSDVHKR